MKLLQMKKLPKSVSFATAIAIVLLGCVVGNQFGLKGRDILFFLDHGDKNTAMDAGAVSVSFDEINELASEKLEGDYIYELTDDGARVLGIKIPMTEKSTLLEYNGVAKAGVKDASQIKWTPDEKAKTITVTCPKVEVLDCHTQIKKIWKTDGSILNHYKFDNMPEVISETEKEFKKVVDKSDLIKRGEQSTRANLINMFHEQVAKDSAYSTYKVKVKWESGSKK